MFMTKTLPGSFSISWLKNFKNNIKNKFCRVEYTHTHRERDTHTHRHTQFYIYRCTFYAQKCMKYKTFINL